MSGAVRRGKGRPMAVTSMFSCMSKRHVRSPSGRKGISRRGKKKEGEGSITRRGKEVNSPRISKTRKGRERDSHVEKEWLFRRRVVSKEEREKGE